MSLERNRIGSERGAKNHTSHCFSATDWSITHERDLVGRNWDRFKDFVVRLPSQANKSSSPQSQPETPAEVNIEEILFGIRGGQYFQAYEAMAVLETQGDVEERDSIANALRYDVHARMVQQTVRVHQKS